MTMIKAIVLVMGLAAAAEGFYGKPYGSNFYQQNQLSSEKSYEIMQKRLKYRFKNMLEEVNSWCFNDKICLRLAFISRLAEAEQTCSMDVSGGDDDDIVITLADMVAASPNAAEAMADNRGCVYEALGWVSNGDEISLDDIDNNAVADDLALTVVGDAAADVESSCFDRASDIDIKDVENFANSGDLDDLLGPYTRGGRRELKLNLNARQRNYFIELSKEHAYFGCLRRAIGKVCYERINGILALQGEGVDLDSFAEYWADPANLPPAANVPEGLLDDFSPAPLALIMGETRYEGIGQDKITEEMLRDIVPAWEPCDPNAYYTYHHLDPRISFTHHQVINIKGCDISTGDEVVDNLPAFAIFSDFDPNGVRVNGFLPVFTPADPEFDRDFRARHLFYIARQRDRVDPADFPFSAVGCTNDPNDNINDNRSYGVIESFDGADVEEIVAATTVHIAPGTPASLSQMCFLRQCLGTGAESFRFNFEDRGGFLASPACNP